MRVPRRPRRSTLVFAVHGPRCAIRQQGRIAMSKPPRPRCRSRCGAPWLADPRLFFEPVELLFQAPDLAIQPIRCAVSGYWLGTSLTLEQRLGLRLSFLFPLADLHWVNSLLLRNLVDSLDTPQRLQSNLRIELRQVDFSFLCFTHDLPVSSDSVLLKLRSRIWGLL